AGLRHLGLEARQRGLLLRAAAAALGRLVALLDQQYLKGRIFGHRHQADVPRLVDLADFQLPVAEDLAVALGPSQRFLARADLEQKRRRRQLALAGVRPRLRRALALAEGEPRSRAARVQTGAVDELAGLRVLA